jgi:putative transposase
MSRRFRIFNKVANLHFITSTISNHKRIFADGNICNDSYCVIIINSMKHQLVEHKANLIAYVIMPSHLHFIVFIPEAESTSDFIRDFKKYTSFNIRNQLYHDRNYDMIEIFREASPTGGCKIWTDRFDDKIIVTEHALKTKIDYIHDNPRRAGLVKEITDWKYTSARNYYLDDNSIIEVGFPEN